MRRNDQNTECKSKFIGKLHSRCKRRIKEFGGREKGRGSGTKRELRGPL